MPAASGWEPRFANLLVESSLSTSCQRRNGASVGGELHRNQGRGTTKSHSGCDGRHWEIAPGRFPCWDCSVSHRPESSVSVSGEIPQPKRRGYEMETKWKRHERQRSRCRCKLLIGVVAGAESNHRHRIFRPLLWHTQSELDTFLTHSRFVRTQATADRVWTILRADSSSLSERTHRKRSGLAPPKRPSPSKTPTSRRRDFWSERPMSCL